MPPVGGLLEESLRHLRAACVPNADEENPTHAPNPNDGLRRAVSTKWRTSLNNAPQEVTATIARVPVGSERNGRSAVAPRANGDFTLSKIEGRPLAKRFFTATIELPREAFPKGMGSAREERPAGVVLNEPVVRAAGGVVARRKEGTTEVLLVHRPKYDDWTFPKGKALPGESDEDCAPREVEEETGLRCALEHELPSTAYRDRKGRRKVVRYWTVRYWTMRALDDEVQPCHEVDEALWLTLEQADALLSYDRDRAVLAALAQEKRA